MVKKFILFFFIGTLSFSCINKGKKYFNKGKLEFQQDNFDFAAENMKQALNYEGIPKGEAAYVIGESYRLSNRWDQAEQYYRKALESGETDENALFYYGYAMKANGNYEGAKSQFQKYLQVGTNFDYLSRAKKEIRNIEILEKLAMIPPKYEVENCKGLNSEYIDYSPTVSGNDFYFTSSRGEGPMFPGQGTRFTDIFKFKFDGLEPYSGIAVPMPEIINEAKTHEATCTFTPDRSKMYFSRSNTGKKNDPTQEVDILETSLVNGEWTEPEILSFCGTYSWDSNPFLTKDGKTLYFASNRAGGYGSDDIWKTTLDEFGVWGEPENLGPIINTAGAEQFPTIDYEGNLYFSSDGHPSFGGLDVFKAIQKEDGSYLIRNLGKPINSSADDFSALFLSDSTGYFCSNREGGVGDDDIYSFKYTFKPHYILHAQIFGRKIVVSKDDEEEVLLPGAKVTLLDAKGEIIDMGVADSNATIKFYVDAEKEYFLKGQKEGFITRQQEYSTVGKTVSQKKLELLEKNVILHAKVILDKSVKDGLIDFQPIYYKYNKWDITQKSEIILNEMVQVLKDNPNILVELGSHTDPRGTMKYNDVLSQNRAESAVKYIIDNGISKDRITAKGYGEREPKVLEKDTSIFKAGTRLDDVFLDSLALVDSMGAELGYQLDRRTEFKIVGFIEENHNPMDIEMIKKGRDEEIIEDNNIKHEDMLIDRHLKKEDEVEEQPEGETTPEEAP